MFYEWWVGTATANIYSEKPLDYNLDYNQLVVLWPVSQLGLHNCLQSNSCTLKTFTTGMQYVVQNANLTFFHSYDNYETSYHKD